MNAPADQDQLFRASVVGASEVSALFDCNPWLTRYELWQRKAGNIAVPTFDTVGPDGVPENERIYWGVRLEGAIINAAKERYGYTDREQVKYLSNDNGLGGHPDRRVICQERGPGILETKMVDWLERKKWGDEPPLHYLLQNQTYQGLDHVTWGDVIVLVGGNKLERFQYDFRPKLYAEIEARVASFWGTVRAGVAPNPDYSRDGKVIAEIYTDAVDSVVDLRGDHIAMTCAAEYQIAAEQERAAKARKEAAQAELLDKLKHNAVGLLDAFTIKATPVKATPDRTTKPGEIIKGRKAYRRFSIKELD